MLCSWARHFTLTAPLSTQVYKWVLCGCFLHNIHSSFISLIEIPQVERLYGPINMSVGANMFINVKLDIPFLSFVCAKLNVCSREIA